MPDVFELKLGSQVEKEAQVFNLTDVPLKLSLFQMLSFQFRDELIDYSISSQFSALQSSIEQSLTNEKIGFLIEIRVYSNEFGIPYVPGGSLINPIGIGTEPLDSLAEYKRKPQLTVKVEGANLVNNSHYLWIVKRDGVLSSKTIDKVFYDNFNGLAQAEADRRDLLGKWEHSLPASSHKSINVANYWLDIYETNKKNIQNAVRADEINRLNEQMKELNAQANDYYKKYQMIEEKLAQQESYFNMLNDIKAVSNLIGGAIEAQKAFCSDKAIKTSPDNSSSVFEEKIEFQREVASDGKTHKYYLKTEYNHTVDSIYDSEARLRTIYQTEGIPLPVKESPFKLP